MSTDDAAAVIVEYDALWCALDFEAASGLWDADDPDCAYCAEEYRGPQLGWDELNAHWARLGARLRRARASTATLQTRLVAPNVALVLGLRDWELTGVGSDDVYRGQNWITVLLRRRSPGWRIFHYAETPAYEATA